MSKRSYGVNKSFSTYSVHAVWLGEQATENETGKRVKFVFHSFFFYEKIISNERKKNEVREKVKMAKWICSQRWPFWCLPRARQVSKQQFKNSSWKIHFLNCQNLTKGIWHNKQLRVVERKILWKFKRGLFPFNSTECVCYWFFIIFSYPSSFFKAHLRLILSFIFFYYYFFVYLQGIIFD